MGEQWVEARDRAAAERFLSLGNVLQSLPITNGPEYNGRGRSTVRRAN